MTSDRAAEQPADEPAPADIRIVGGDPTPAELAAVTAVLTVSLEELAAQERRSDEGPTAWERSQRRMREPLIHGTWAEFGR